MGDARLRARAPLDQLDERTSPLDLLAGGAGLAPPGDGHAFDAEGFQLGVDLGLAIAPVSGHRLGRSTEAGGDAGDGGDQHGRIGRVADHDGVVQHHAVGVIAVMRVDIGITGSYAASRVMPRRGAKPILHTGLLHLVSA
jgi:hypothetical protein